MTLFALIVHVTLTVAACIALLILCVMWHDSFSRPWERRARWAGYLVMLWVFVCAVYQIWA